MQNEYLAHIREIDNEEQTILNHLTATAELAKKFGKPFHSEDNAYICGLLHDVGKYSEKFQKRIRNEGGKVDHSTAGAQEIVRLMPTIGCLLAYCIAGHHTGLPDGGSIADTCDESTLRGRLKRTIEPFDAFRKDINQPVLPVRLPIRPLEDKGFSVAFYVRMLFSCLVDGDFLDTEKFMNGSLQRGSFESINDLVKKFDQYITKYTHPERALDIKRTEVLNCCIQNAVWNRGLYTLTVPTGGGKTIASLAFALKHAKEHQMERIIYVIPYNSIIEQNAAVFKSILGVENVLEHHSNFSYDDIDESLKNYYQLSAENWDMPVIVTTNVQFFESLFANRTSKCRKLHNLANSVIIFDEAQMLPTQYLLPCIRAVAELIYNFGSTAILCSATQPTLGPLFPKELVSREICENTVDLFNTFKKVQFLSAGELSDEELANRINTEKQVLCIVNSRKQAQKLFSLLEKDAFHLSTYMVPADRKNILQEIRTRLDHGLDCRVVSTSLIEAGVDIDFPIVYRAEAGLDSQIQAAGRCNREGKQAIGSVYIFIPAKEYRDRMPAQLKRPTAVARSIATQFDDVTTSEAISAYFSQLYYAEGDGLDTKQIVARFEEGFGNGLNFPFSTVASSFNLIDDITRAIIIPSIESQPLIQRLRSGERNRELLRKIQLHIVNAYPQYFDTLYAAGYIEILDEELAALIDPQQYSTKTGLNASVKSGVGVFR